MTLVQRQETGSNPLSFFIITRLPFSEEKKPTGRMRIYISNLVIWLSGYKVIRLLSGYQVIWLSSYMGIRLSESMVI